MSHPTNAITNKYQKHPKVNFLQYLYNSDEPDDDSVYGIAPKIRAKLEEHPNRYYTVMRRQVRLNAKRLRMDYL